MIIVLHYPIDEPNIFQTLDQFKMIKFGQILSFFGFDVFGQYNYFCFALTMSKEVTISDSMIYFDMTQLGF